MLGEVGDALVEMVVLGEFGALGDKRVAFALEAAGAHVELAGTPCHVGVVDHPGLVEVGEAAALGGCVFEPAAKALVGSNAAFGAAAVLAPSADRVVVGAQVVACEPG
ncbi:MAG: hypothetical protein ACRDYY_07530 [Acidimicrobiales bacterium]